MRFLGLLLVFLVLPVFVFAVPGTPHQFYGSVFADGKPAPDNLEVKAVVDGEVYGVGLTKGGSYGLSPDIFYVRDPHNELAGKMIVFYVNGVRAGSHVFMNGHSTRLDLSCVSCLPSRSSSRRSSSHSSSGGGGSFVPPVVGSKSVNDSGESSNLSDSNVSDSNVSDSSSASECVPDWVCTDFTVCSNGVKKRKCVDANRCGRSDGPVEVVECPNVDSGVGEEVVKTPVKAPLSTGFVVRASAVSVGFFFVVILLVGLGFVLWRRRR